MPDKDTAILFKAGAQVSYDTIVPDASTVYFTTDSHRLFVGDVEYSRPVQHGASLPTGFNPPNSLFYHTVEKALYYSESGTSWVACSNFYTHPDFEAMVLGDQVGKTLDFGDSFKIPKITVNGQGHVAAGEDIEFTLPAAPDVRAISTTGDGNALTAVTVDPETDAITFTKGATFALASDVEEAIEAVKATADTATTPEEVDEKIQEAVAGITQFDIDEGPEGAEEAGYDDLAALEAAHAEGKKGVFYLVKNPEATDDNKYIEYIWNGTAYEQVGKFGTVDTSNFATKDEIVQKLESAVAGDIATLTADGQIQDSGIKAADLATKEELATKADASIKINGHALSDGDITIEDVSGNADTATKLETPVTINGVEFDGSKNIEIPTATTVEELTDAAITDPEAHQTLVYDEATEKWINRALNKDDIGLDKVDNTSDAEKNVATAAKLVTERTIQLTGNATGSAQFDGSADASINVTVNYATNAGNADELNGVAAADYALKTDVEAATLKWGTF